MSVRWPTGAPSSRHLPHAGQSKAWPQRRRTPAELPHYQQLEHDIEAGGKREDMYHFRDRIPRYLSSLTR
jgi:hypothetical protein